MAWSEAARAAAAVARQRGKKGLKRKRANLFSKASQVSRLYRELKRTQYNPGLSAKAYEKILRQKALEKYYDKN